MPTRLDVLLFNRKLFKSRQKASEAIVSGCISVNGKLILKPGSSFSDDIEITVSPAVNRYVSRGGIKLEYALQFFNIDVRDKVILDVGASTGGFTDCLLSHGASKVYALDVGHGQLAPELRDNNKVVVLEGINARDLKPGEIGCADIDMAVVDVSFISLTKVLLPTALQLKDSADIICLVKPQFEVGLKNIGKNGIVKSRDLRAATLEEIKAFASGNGLTPVADTESPITGGDGNIEFLLHIRKRFISCLPGCGAPGSSPLSPEKLSG